MDLEDLVLEDGRVVVQLALEDGPFRNLDESRRHLDAAPPGQLGILRPGSPGRVSFRCAGDACQAQDEEQQAAGHRRILEQLMSPSSA